MKIGSWFQKRGISFIVKRAKSLRERYDFSPQKAIERVSRNVEELSAQGCSPTFFVPAVVVGRNLPFFKVLQECGCEIGVHGFQHVDLTSYPPEEANRQLQRAADFLRSNGFMAEGFRCPYLSSSDDLMHALTPNVFNYSSNRAITWKNNESATGREKNLFSTIERFYHPLLPESTLRLPWVQEGVVEIPVCVPDDLQLYDGLGLSKEEISIEWLKLLKGIHQNGEMFNLMFHPELSAEFGSPFLTVLRATHQLDGRVWVANLREVGRWWRRKDRFGVSFLKNGATWHMQFSCDPQATILFRGVQIEGRSTPWDERYQRLLVPEVQVRGGLLPLLGLAEELPDWVETDLQRMGYITLRGAEGRDCSTILDQGFLTHVHDAVALRDKIEDMEIPLIRYWPWPDGARSALSLSGDLDALSLMDYSTRLLPI